MNTKAIIIFILIFVLSLLFWGSAYVINRQMAPAIVEDAVVANSARIQ